MLSVHLRINDSSTGKPTPVRLRISGPDGTTYPPLGRSAEFPNGRNEDVGGHLWVGRQAWCYIDGSCEIPLPASIPLRVQVQKGFEYVPLDREVTLGPGRMALRFEIERWSNLAAEGWISADSRCHFLSPHSALLEAAAEDVAIVNLLACSQPWPSFDGKTYPSVPNLIAFSGQSPVLESDGRIVAVNTLNRHPVLGSVGLLDSHRIVFPLTFGGDESDDWSICDWCDQCHRKGGLTTWVSPFSPVAGQIRSEALIAAILGKIDAIEIDSLPRTQPLLPWVYRMWNAGFPIPLVGGSGKDGNAVALGAMRTYSKRPREEPLTYRSWVESVRVGQTFVTNGPLLTWSFESPRFTAQARSRIPFEKLELIRNGEVLAMAAASVTDNLYTATIETDVAATPPGWLAARVTGSHNAFAHTSPFRVGKEPPHLADARQQLARLVEQTRDWISEHGRFTLPKSKAHLLELADMALARLGVST